MAGWQTNRKMRRVHLNSFHWINAVEISDFDNETSQGLMSCEVEK